MIRVLQALESSSLRAKLRAKIPKAFLQAPELDFKYPSPLIKALPKTYFDLGILSEVLLRLENCDVNLMSEVVKRLFKVVLPENVLTLKSTLDYIDAIKATRSLISDAAHGEKLDYNRELTLNSIQGHPDIITNSSVFEIKTSGRIKQDWSKFVLQAFCYAALAPHVKSVHIVLPLQKHVETFNLSQWPKRKDFTDILSSVQPPDEDYKLAGKLLQSNFNIGTHIAKTPKISAVLSKLSSKMPYQIFLSMSSKLDIKDEEIALCSQITATKNLNVYVHAPYIVNLCDTKEYITETISKQMNIADACGFMGVVIHVGKSTKLSIPKALENMKNNILEILNNTQGTLFLETPAGQGTEVLTKLDDFMGFVTEAVNHPRLKVCVDTCHVFASGTQPDEYLKALIKHPKWQNKLALIHFNDSDTEFNSKVDRHADIGCGKIDFPRLLHCAELAHKLKIHMIKE